MPSPAPKALRVEQLGEPRQAELPRIVAAVLVLYGIPISDDDCRALVASLLADGSPDALAAAGRISKRLESTAGRGLVALTAEHRDAILQLLEDPQSPALVELRGRLADDAGYRHGLAKRDG